VAKVGLVALVGVVLRKMETVLPLLLGVMVLSKAALFVTAKSGFPSLLKSPILTDQGAVPVPKVTWVAKVRVVLPVGVVLSRMEVFSPQTFAVARSGLPSPLKSPMLTELGPLPTLNLTWVAKDGVLAPVAVVLRSMEAVLSPIPFTVTKSGFPSPLKSPTLRSAGKFPVGKSTAGAKSTCGMGVKTPPIDGGT
jgi:hypothetical protein